MSTIVAWPTIDLAEANKTAEYWQKMGYDVGILVDESQYGDDFENPWNVNASITVEEWQGFPHAANEICTHFASLYDIVIIGGDDVYPDKYNVARHLEAEFKEHFGGTFGVMNPTGDRYGLIDQCCIAPWIGAEYIYALDGRPYCEEYYHYFCDGELQDVAILNGSFWQRPDLSQYHDHWSRKGESRPKHLQRANQQHSDDKRTYEQRKAQGFKDKVVVR